MSLHHPIRLVALGIAALIATPAAAQMTPDFTMVGNAVAGVTLPVVLNPCFGGRCSATDKSRTKAAASSKRASVAPASHAPAAASPRVDLSYTPSPAVRQRLADDLAGEMERQGGPAAAAEVRRLVLSGDVVKAYDGSAGRYGLKPNDVADAYVFYVVSQWAMATGETSDQTPAQIAGVRRQIAGGFAALGGQLGDPATRQRIAEELIVRGAIGSSAFNQAVAKNDTAMLAQLKASGEKNGRQMLGMSPAALALTDAGFAPR